MRGVQSTSSVSQEVQVRAAVQLSEPCYFNTITVGVHPDLLYVECLQPTFFTKCMHVHVNIIIKKKILNKYKTILC